MILPQNKKIRDESGINSCQGLRIGLSKVMCIRSSTREPCGNEQFSILVVIVVIKAIQVIQLQRTILTPRPHTHTLISACKTGETTINLQFPGFDIVLELNKMSPLGETEWRVSFKTTLYIFFFLQSPVNL